MYINYKYNIFLTISINISVKAAITAIRRTYIQASFKTEHLPPADPGNIIPGPVIPAVAIIRLVALELIYVAGRNLHRSYDSGALFCPAGKMVIAVHIVSRA